ncbi:hypothetical protein B9R14_10660 [Acetivibrio saccincola]|jgi:undecaprenyl-diphosphatase|uniref:Phosphatidic acid phosphatase type 2/haloperoxidase domain-containing protein n=2 Tax=Acetivibrio saccincola TaxID=1677857 RepID=A0A2S8RBL9_9FIRM|nr:hypothetical protein B9R14_10660 [Acetivibrio saccincola]
MRIYFKITFKHGETAMSIDAKLFLKLYGFVSGKQQLKKALYFINRGSSIFFVALYTGCVLWLLFCLDRFLIKFLLIPALVLITVTILRKIINRKRPFEALGIETVVSHGKSGSFPSRHASSAMIIALSLHQINPAAGYLCICLALITAVSRVLAGVHYPLDVLAGILISFLFSLLFFI